MVPLELSPNLVSGAARYLECYQEYSSSEEQRSAPPKLLEHLHSSLVPRDRFGCRQTGLAWEVPSLELLPGRLDFVAGADFFAEIGAEMAVPSLDSLDSVVSD